MNRALLIASTHVDSVFAERVIAHLSQQDRMPYIVAADGGLTTLDALGIAPQLLVGDFDTVKPELLERYLGRDDIEVLRHNPVKDDSDLALAVEAVAEQGCSEIYVLGALGGRCDHSLANMRLCYAWKKKGVSLFLLDPQNRIRCVLAREGRFSVGKNEQWGTYLAFFPIGGTVKIKALVGVRYPLRDFCLCDNTAPTLTVSNEITAERAELELSGDPMSGLLIMETCDREESKWIMP